MQVHIINKSIIRDFYRRAVAQGDIAFADQVLADEYIQHSPMVKPGKVGVLEALQYMQQMPKPATTAQPFMRLIADGEYVVTNMSFTWANKQKAVVDVFRLGGEKIVEHWDAVQDQPETSVNGNALMDGPADVENTDATQVNKQTVEMFYQRVFIQRQLEELSGYVHPDLIQHHPSIDNGVAGLKNYLLAKSNARSVRTMHRVIGEGNFVVVQAEGKANNTPYVMYDIFRLGAGKIAEQWSVYQIIPETLAHDNGMI